MKTTTASPVRLPSPSTSPSLSLVALVEGGRAQQRHDALVSRCVAGLVSQTPVDLTDADVIVPAERPTRANDRVHDGAIVGAAGLFSPLTSVGLVAPVLPDNGAERQETVILINGIMTDVALQQADMQGLANTGCAVVGVHNSTAGMAADLLECVLNKLDRGDTPAIDTVSRLLAQALERDEPVRLVGHSQGALIIGRALQIVSDALAAQGLSSAQIGTALGRITVETYGGACACYVDGPRYTHVLNRADIVPLLAGVALDAINPFGHVGQGAELKAFVEAHLPRNLPSDQGLEWAGARAVDQAIHGPRDVYWAHRR